MYISVYHIAATIIVIMFVTIVCIIIRLFVIISLICLRINKQIIIYLSKRIFSLLINTKRWLK